MHLLPNTTQHIITFDLFFQVCFFIFYFFLNLFQFCYISDIKRLKDFVSRQFPKSVRLSFRVREATRNNPAGIKRLNSLRDSLPSERLGSPSPQRDLVLPHLREAWQFTDNFSSREPTFQTDVLQPLSVISYQSFIQTKIRQAKAIQQESSRE